MFNLWRVCLCGDCLLLLVILEHLRKVVCGLSVNCTYALQLINYCLCQRGYVFTVEPLLGGLLVHMMQKLPWNFPWSVVEK